MDIYVQVGVNKCMQFYMYICMDMCMCICVCVCARVCACGGVCTHVRSPTHTFKCLVSAL